MSDIHESAFHVIPHEHLHTSGLYLSLQVSRERLDRDRCPSNLVTAQFGDRLSIDWIWVGVTGL